MKKLLQTIILGSILSSSISAYAKPCQNNYSNKLTSQVAHLTTKKQDSPLTQEYCKPENKSGFYIQSPFLTFPNNIEPKIPSYNLPHRYNNSDQQTPSLIELGVSF